ncbi:hypothetical protein TRFO_42679 [Tritrichomonas foetus]|uniref:Uncharacterized protein n=1 Tax=Tritrichomonas foetus TaxID=1144522 RepID=A0A1J4KV85_9EUKA|nr:hypothetical protein TRFO_42679 [Tritrichomonas foetus]|eukprot:OHT15147.1 hypothetical protein TRFO_42679 [Tritrichomonas foetus]
MSEAPQKDSLFSRFLMLPFKILNPPILETPLSTFPLPKPIFTMTLVFLSFFGIIGGFVYCYINHSPFMATSYDEKGRTHVKFYEDGFSSQTITEGILVSCIYCMGGFSAICAFLALTHENKKALSYKMLYRFGCTLPIWMVAAFEVFHMKATYYFPFFDLASLIDIIRGFGAIFSFLRKVLMI